MTLLFLVSVCLILLLLDLHNVLIVVLSRFIFSFLFLEIRLTLSEFCLSLFRSTDDVNRVILSTSSPDQTSYINASFIQVKRDETKIAFDLRSAIFVHLCPELCRCCISEYATPWHKRTRLTKYLLPSCLSFLYELPF